MSDGPYKTLKMSTGWRRAARFAAIGASSPDDNAQALTDALDQECRTWIRPELVTALRKLFGDESQSSLCLNEPDRFAMVRLYANGSSLGVLLAEHAIMVANEGWQGTKALREVIRRTLMERAYSGAKQVEEHHFRKADDGMSSTVRQRIESAADNIDHAKLANQILGIEPKRIRQLKQILTGIDDGPRW